MTPIEFETITPEQIEILDKLFEKPTETDEDYRYMAENFAEDV